MDSSRDCLSYARPSRVVCKYFVSGSPSQIYAMSFGSLSHFDAWRYERQNHNKVVVSLHITYKYESEFLSEDGCILK